MLINFFVCQILHASLEGSFKRNITNGPYVVLEDNNIPLMLAGFDTDCARKARALSCGEFAFLKLKQYDKDIEKCQRNKCHSSRDL